MIIQCDQCKTKFRLDDSKVTDAGVRVRCSRCKSTFVVKKEEIEDVLDAHETTNFPENSESETERQDDVSAGFLPGQKTALPEDENGDGRDIGSSLTGCLPTEVDEQVEKANNGNNACLDDFGFVGNTLANSSNVDESTAVERCIVDDQKEDSFNISGADFSGFSETAADEGDGGIFRPEREDLSEKSGKDTSSGSFLKSQDILAGEGNFGQSDWSEPESDESWDIFPPVTEPETGKPATTGKELFFNYQDQSSVNQENIARVMNDGVLSPPDEGEGGAPHKTMFAASSMEETPAPYVGTVSETDGEDLPPLAISSRKKRSFFSPAVFVVMFVTVIAAGGAAYHYSWLDFSSFKIPALAGITGGSISNQVSNIAIRNLDGVYLHNVYGGDLFVVTGEASNNSGKTLDSVQVQGYVYGKKGEVLLKKTANFVNTLSIDQLTTLPVNEIEAILKNSPAKSTNDVSMQPGTASTFQIVFTHVPEVAGEFGAEVTGSKVARQ